MALLRILGLALAWLFTPSNLLATAVTTAAAYSWGYVEGYRYSSKTVDSRVKAGLKTRCMTKKPPKTASVGRMHWHWYDVSADSTVLVPVVKPRRQVAYGKAIEVKPNTLHATN